MVVKRPFFTFIFAVLVLLAGCRQEPTWGTKIAICYKLFMVAIIFVLLAACRSDENAATAVPPNIDGILAPGEWDTAVVENLTDGSELFIMQDDHYLYLGIRSVTPGMIGANVFVEEGGQVRIMHTSAALGTAVYQQNGSIWQQTQNFDWQCRDTSDSAAAQAERAAYLQENHWLAANSRLGTPTELEYQIERKDTALRIAVSVFRSSSPDERAFWPPTLNDDTIQPHPGGLPETLDFSLEQWAILALE